ncbi:MAG: YbbR-like domain-containing protein [Candidatus Binatia bacterium]
MKKWFEREQLQMAWAAVRKAVVDPDRIRQLLTRNLALKILSLLIAFSIWFFVNFGERDTEETLRAPLELRNIPAHLMITSPKADFIDLRVSGPRALLGRIDRDRLAISLDLGGVRPGPAVFRVDADSLNLPRGVKVLRITPAQLTLELERVGHKSVPVHLRLGGKPPPGVQVVDTKVAPETVQVTGPASDVQDVQSANTEPFDIHDARPGTIERELALESPSEYLAFSANRVAAQVRIEESPVTREFKRVTVTVRNAALRYQVSPDHVRVIVRGPKRLVDGLEMDNGAVYIDAEGATAGDHFMKPNVELPSGVLLVSTEPAKLQLTLAKGKPSKRARH